MSARQWALAACSAAILVHVVAATTSKDPDKRQFQPGEFSGTADQVASFDPHDYVPSHYSRVRVAHATIMSVVWIVIFPIGGIIPHVMADPRLVRAHAILQMIGFWLNVGAAAMGIWMAKQIDQLYRYHPIIGLGLFTLLLIQPITEIADHRLYKDHPKVIYAAYLHLWLGRLLLLAGAIQGGLGFLFASEFKNAVVETWPRVAYGVVAVVVWSTYVCVGIVWPEVRGGGKVKGLRRSGVKGRVERDGPVRMRAVAVAAGEMESLRADRFAYRVHGRTASQV